MKKLAFIFLLLLFGFKGVTQSEDESTMSADDDVAAYHLSPVKSYFDTSDEHHHYLKRLKEVLLKGLRSYPMARIVILPSFEAESVISLENHKGVYFIIEKKFDRNFYQAEDKKILKVISSQHKVTCDVAQGVAFLFEKMLLQTYYDNKNYAGFDGITYYFSGGASPVTFRVGKIWSPSKRSGVYRVIKFMEDLATENTIEESKFNTQLNELLAYF